MNDDRLETASPILACLERGLGLIDALAALLVFSLGLLALGSVYARLAPASLEDQKVVSAAELGNAFWGVVQADWPQLQNPARDLAFTAGAGSQGAVPSFLNDWVSDALAVLPGASIQSQPGADPLGNPCSPQSCGLTLTLQWRQGLLLRQQVFHEQFGF